MKTFKVKYEYILSIEAEDEEEALEHLDYNLDDYLHDSIYDYTNREIISEEEEDEELSMGD